MKRMIPRKKSFGFQLLFITLIFSFSLARSQTVDSFDPNANDYVFTTIPQTDGAILLGGQFTSIGNQPRTNLARFRPDGTLDPAFIANTRRSSGMSHVSCIAMQENGQIIVGGYFNSLAGGSVNNIGRLNPDGSLDSSFNVGFLNMTIKGMAIQRDGKILICGLNQISSPTSIGLCRLNTNGSLDMSFASPTNGGVISIALQQDGKILAQGKFSTGQFQTNLVRLNADGSVDSSFQNPIFTHWATGLGGALSVQPDGKILVGGLFSTVNGEAHTNIVRLNSDGAVDSAFTTQAFGGSWGVQTVVLQTDQKILIGNDSNPSSCPLFRLNTDGIFDMTFDTNLVAGRIVFCAALQPDGSILAGGSFNMLGGETRPNAGRLINTEAATQNLSFDGTNIIWLRGGTSPEASYTTFESSANGAEWTYLGDGERISGGWQLSGVSVATNVTIRARAFMNGGRHNGSSWFVESVYPQSIPMFVTSDGNFGIRSNQFNSSITGSAGSTVVVDSSTNLVDWIPIATNLLSSGLFPFTDSSASNSLQKFYRARLP